MSANENAGSTTITGVGQGLAVGPFIGYKLATKVGFSFNIQGGVEYVAVRASASDASGSSRSAAEDSAIIPLLNLNLGWSF